MTSSSPNRAGRRGSVLIESALALLAFAILVAGTMELGLIGFISNSVSFAAQQAARYAAVRGNTSGHAATVADIQGIADQFSTPLATGNLTVTVTAVAGGVNVAWATNNKPGNSVKVTVAYNMQSAVLPLSIGVLNLQGAAQQAIIQ